MLKKHLLFTMAAVIVSAVAVALPATADADAELFTAKTCNTCHGEDAKTPLMPEYPKIAGQSATYAANQMADIKSGARANGQAAVMQAIMAMVSDEEIETLAKYIESLAP